MLTAFGIDNELLTPLTVSNDTKWYEQAIWIELINPTQDELDLVEKLSGMELPNIKETEELEASSLYEVFPKGFQLNSLFLEKVNDTYMTVNNAFVITEKQLISVGAQKTTTASLLQNKWQRKSGFSNDPVSLIISILEQKIDRLADLSEFAYQSIETISHQIFDRSEPDLEDTIDDLSDQDDLNGKIRLCLMEGQRDITFILRRSRISEDNVKNSNEMAEDIRTLLMHNTFISERIDFLLNAALGFINIEQNKIIKIFSIVAVVMMPPTVIASIYGMNFHFMPELSWRFGYPISIVAMIVAAASPYVYFKRKGWL